jgi:hypothetical protein
MAILIPRKSAGAHSKRSTYDSTTEPDFQTMEPMAQLSVASSERNVEPMAAGSNHQFAVGKKTRGLSISDYEKRAKSQNDDNEEIDPTKLVACTTPLLRHIRGAAIYQAGNPVATLAGTQSTRPKRRKSKALISVLAETLTATNPSFQSQATLSTKQMTSIALNSTVEPGSIALLPSAAEPSIDGQRLAKRPRRHEPRADIMTDGTSGGDKQTIGNSGDSSDSESPAYLARILDFLGSVDLDSSPGNNK